MVAFVVKKVTFTMGCGSVRWLRTDVREEEHCHLFSNSYYCCFALASETSTTDDYDDDDDDGPNDAEPIFMINQRLFSPSVSRLRMPAC